MNAHPIPRSVSDALHPGVIEAVKALSDKLETCRRILANSSDWGPVGYQMVLRGDFDDEPEMLRLMAAYEEGVRRVESN